MAIATVVSNIFSTGIVLYILSRENEMIRLYWSKLRLNGAAQYERCKKVLKLCLAGGITATMLVISIFILRRSTLIRIFTVDPALFTLLGTVVAYYLLHRRQLFAGKTSETV